MKKIRKIDLVEPGATADSRVAVIWREGEAKGRIYNITSASLNRLTWRIRLAALGRKVILLPWVDCLGWSARAAGTPPHSLAATSKE